MDADEIEFRQELRVLAEKAGALAAGTRNLLRELEILDSTCQAVFAGSATYTDSTVSAVTSSACERLDSMKSALEDAAALAQTVATQG